MNTHLRDEVIRLLSPHMLITRSAGGTFAFQPQNPRIQDSFPDLDVMKRDISRMSLSEAKRAGIVMYGDASFSIDAYDVGRFQGFAHFVAALIVHKTRGVYELRDIELDVFEPEKGWKTLFGGFAKGVTGSNVFSGRKRLGNPSQACRMVSTGNEQLYAVDCGDSYATLFLQTS